MITAELDPALAHGVMDMFADDDIDVMHADWTELAQHGPFSLIFLDAASAKSWPREHIIDLVRAWRHDRSRRLRALRQLAAARRRPGGQRSARSGWPTSASPAST